MNVSSDVLMVLTACHFSGNKLVLPDQLDRSLYMKTNKVIELAGGKWNRKEKGHLFPGNAEERIDLVMLTRNIEVPKDIFNFFPSPEPLIQRMLAQVNLQATDRFIEPSCGDGRIAIAASAACPGVSITAVELDPLRIAGLRANSAFTATNAELVEGDFLKYNPGTRFDVILMNPPFLNQSDIHHVNHAISMLASGGRLCAIMSAGVIFRTNKLTEQFRDRVSSLGGVIEELEPLTFKQSGTNVNTAMVII